MKKRNPWKSLLALSIAAMTMLSMGQVTTFAEEITAPAAETLENEESAAASVPAPADSTAAGESDTSAVNETSDAGSASGIGVEATSAADENVTAESMAAVGADAAQNQAAVTAIPQYRMYNVYTGEHFYTQNTTERNNMIGSGWNYEGYAWMAADAASGGSPVYRLYNKNSGDHHYTTSAGERDVLVKAGWRYEQIGWYSDPDNGLPVYRLYNPHAKTGTHHYTIQAGERASLVKAGWRYEGIAWYAVNQPTPADDHEAVMKKYRKVTILDKVDAKAQSVKSDTPFQIQVDCTTHQLYVYQGSVNNWQRIHKWPCGDGKPSTPTPRGTTKVTVKWSHFGEPSDTCWYATMFKSPVYLIHSVVYYPGSKTNVMDGRVGQGVSHGCIRLQIQNAKWIYDNIPRGTTVTVFDE